MTIILQYQFWDLSVTDHAFEVGLSFKNLPEMLLVPFEAVTRFSDPAAGFDLEFKLDADALETSANDAGSPAAAPPSAIETAKFMDRDFPPGARPDPVEAPQPSEGGTDRLDRRISQKDLMGEIVNLRRARKGKARADSAAQAAARRLKFGLSRADREAAEKIRDLDRARLDGCRRDLTGLTSDDEFA